MINEIKKLLLEEPKYIVDILEHYEFYNVKINRDEIRCGFEHGSNSTGVRIKLNNNENLFVNDYVRNIQGDLINYIIKGKSIDFLDILNYIKSLLNITDTYYNKETNKGVFGGFYNKIKRQRNYENNNTVHSKDILEKYIDCVSYRFIKDYIPPDTQRFFNVRYDTESQRIVFPIYDWQGNIIGIKGRANWNISDEEPKYLYLVKCNILNTLYGYWQNYKYMVDGIVIITEAEKSVMQGYSYGNRNIVALGNNTISTQQCRLIMMLNPKKVIFANDEGLNLEITKKNIDTLKLFTRMKDTEICFWDYRKSGYVGAGSKESITDNGSDIFYEILNNEIYDWSELYVES